MVIARCICGLLRLSSKRRTITSHLVLRHKCFAEAFNASENKDSPAARSTSSTVTFVRNLENCLVRSIVPGTIKLSKGAVSGMTAFGSTNAPVEISGISGVDGDEGLDVKMTFAK